MGALITGHNFGILRFVWIVLAHQNDSRRDVELLVCGRDFIDETENVQLEAHQTVSTFTLRLSTSILFAGNVVARRRRAR